MLGVCGASLVSLGWLVLGVTAVMGNVQTLKIRLYIFQVRLLVLTQPFWFPAVSLCKSCVSTSHTRIIVNCVSQVHYKRAYARLEKVLFFPT